VDFLQTTNLMVRQARLSNYTYYSGTDFTYTLDQTTVTVGAPRILAISTSPASAGASSSASAATGPPTPVVMEGSGLLDFVDAGGSPAPVACCADSGTISSTVGVGLRLLSVAPPTVSQLSSAPCSTGSDDGISCDNTRFHYQHTILHDKCRCGMWSRHSPVISAKVYPSMVDAKQ
jgi:hypothetical protein